MSDTTKSGNQTKRPIGRPPSITPEDFVRAWMKYLGEKQSFPALAQHLGLTRRQLSTRAYNLRRQGIPLPVFPRASALDRAHVLKDMVDQAQGRILRARLALDEALNAKKESSVTGAEKS